MSQFIPLLKRRMKWLLLGTLPLILHGLRWIFEAAIGHATVTTIEHRFHLLERVASNPLLSSVVLTCGVFIWAVGDSKFREWRAEDKARVESPNILVSKNGFRAGITRFTEPHPDPKMIGVELDWLRVYLTNDAKHLAETNEARSVFAKATFFNVDGQTKRLHAMDCRWIDGGYPGEKPRDELLLKNIHPGQEAGLDLVIKYRSEDDCYAMNNYNWEVARGDLKYEPHRLIGQDFVMELAVRAEGFVGNWEPKFRNEGRGRTLRPIYCRRVSS